MLKLLQLRQRLIPTRRERSIFSQFRTTASDLEELTFIPTASHSAVNRYKTQPSEQLVAPCRVCSHHVGAELDAISWMYDH